MTPKKILLVLAASAVAIAWLGNYTDIDLWLAHAMYDAGSGSFPMRHAWFAEKFSHAYMRNFMVVLGLCFVLPAAVDLVRPRAGWSAGFRLRLRVVALSAIMVPLAISVLKQASSSHCPWDLAEFGGVEAYVRLFDAALPGARAGGCMPAGHPSSALWLISLGVFCLPHRPRQATAVFCAMLGLGFFLGWMQQLRGAHFLSHTLWSMWIACAIVSVIYGWILRPWRLPPARLQLGAQPPARAGGG